MIKIKLTTSGKEYETKGKTIAEALEKFDLSWENIKAKGTVTLIDGDKTYEHLFNMKVLRRIFSNKIVLQTWAKRLGLLFEGDRKTNI